MVIDGLYISLKSTEMAQIWARESITPEKAESIYRNKSKLTKSRNVTAIQFRGQIVHINKTPHFNVMTQGMFYLILSSKMDLQTSNNLKFYFHK